MRCSFQMVADPRSEGALDADTALSRDGIDDLQDNLKMTHASKVSESRCVRRPLGLHERKSQK